jgi:hypothetical protein
MLQTHQHEGSAPKRERLPRHFLKRDDVRRSPGQRRGLLDEP